MNESKEVHIFIDSDVQEILADNETDIVDLLHEGGVDTEVSISNLVNTPDEGYKEPAMIIIASAALVLAMVPILSKVLNYLSPTRSILVKKMVLKPVEDSVGNVVRDSTGEPILQWIEDYQILESSTDKATEDSLSIEGFGIKIGFNDLND